MFLCSGLGRAKDATPREAQVSGIGFCQRDQVPKGGLVTFFYPGRAQVDEQYEKFKSRAVAKPKLNPKYEIYHFFAHDPEGRMIEFQYFEGKIDWDFNRTWK
jgi:hypothetical protein